MGRTDSPRGRDETVGMRADRIIDIASAEAGSAGARLAAWIRSMPQPLVVADPEGSVLFLNAEAERVLAVYGTQWVGRPAHELLHGAADGARRCPADPCPLLSALSDGVSRRAVRGVFHDADGSAVHVRYSTGPVYAAGRLEATILVFADVTEGARTEEWRERRLRARVASEIHDGPLPVMAAVRTQLDALGEHAREPRERDLLRELGRSVEASIGELRHLLTEFTSPGLSAGGLVAALGNDLDQAKAEGGFSYRLHTGIEEECPDDAYATVYGIAQEALANVRSHARAGQVDVALERLAGGVRVRIADDGVGFSPEWNAPPGHVGLRIMRQRAEMAGGWFRVESTPGEGTVVEYWVPCEPDPKAGP
jgi:PAS domain S-box-containing protein